MNLNRRHMIGLMAAAFALPAVQAQARTMTLTGTVTYRERMMLPPNSTVEVSLVDVSLADAPSKTIARQVIRRARTSPTRFKLAFDSSQIRKGRTYALQARITQGKQLLFINTTRHTVFDGGPNNTEIRVERVAGEPSAELGIAGEWLAEDINGRGVIDNLQTTLKIDANGAVSGKGGCNGYGGSAKITGNRIRFGSLMSTQMACAPAIMNQESKFHAALGEARSWRIDQRRRKLTLLDRRGRPVAVLSRVG
ncbi:YbaY family lipoprotein [Mesorhizobium sp. NPDC059054]|uniref:YbaY family lipoprotein n=1 Tax=Mesorhizobium sp. NPDC059054 TaxID=3346711 RepID=UPI0036B81C13